MTFLERITLLMEQKGVNKSTLCSQLKINQNSFVNWTNRGTLPSGETLIKLAEYFGVSIDYLVGYSSKNEENPKIQKLIDFASRLTDEQLESFIDTYSKLLDSLKK